MKSMNQSDQRIMELANNCWIHSRQFGTPSQKGQLWFAGNRRSDTLFDETEEFQGLDETDSLLGRWIGVEL